MTMLGNMILGMGGMLFTFMAVPVYMFVLEYPIQTANNMTLRELVKIKIIEAKLL
jgi:uncharacterized membrane protein YfcA